MERFSAKKTRFSEQPRASRLKWHLPVRSAPVSSAARVLYYSACKETGWPSFIIERRLGSGEKLRVDTGCIVGFEPSVDYDIQFVGGFKNALFGGEGIFLATLTGPGLVYLQSLPFSRLADRILAAATYRRQDESSGLAGFGGGILGGLLGGDRGD